MASVHGVRLPLCLGLLVACGGSETGNPVENGDVGESAGCEVAGSTSLPFDRQSALGFAAADLLDNAGGTRQQTLRWQTLRFGSYGPETGEQTLHVTITPVGSTARLVDYRQKQGGGEIALDCADQLEVDVELRLVSGGGALDETVRSKLVARRAEVSTLSASFDPEKLAGSLTVSAAELGAGWQVRALNLSVQATRYALSGSLAASFEKRTSDSVGQSPGAGPLAVFGLAPCDNGIAVPLSATGTASSAATLSLLMEHANASLTTGSSEQAVTLAFEPAGDACQLFADEYAADAGPAVQISGALVVKAADGAIDGRWPVVVRGNPDPTGALVGPVTLELDSRANAAGSTLAERYGITQLDTTGYDSTGVRVMFSLSAESGWSGSIVVEGFVDPVCPAAQPGSSSSPGCPGSERSELASWQLHD